MVVTVVLRILERLPVYLARSTQACQALGDLWHLQNLQAGNIKIYKSLSEIFRSSLHFYKLATNRNHRHNIRIAIVAKNEKGITWGAGRGGAVWEREGFCCASCRIHKVSIENLCANDNRDIKVEMPNNWQISVEKKWGFLI